ncbi:MAG: WD40/YVTN/BNR-like repeat-containing protein [Burkholderiales bacterium]
MAYRRCGAHWEPVDDLMANLAVACLTMDPKNPAVMYAGTGEGFSNVDAIRGAGVFRTLDGVVWKQLPATATADFNAVNRLAVSKTGKVVLAATNNGLFRSSDSARTAWTKVLDAPVADVRFDPKSSTRAIAGGLDNGEAWYSNNSGRNWTLAAHTGAWKGRVELCYAAKSSKIVYASVQMEHGEIWRSSDAGRTYQRRATQTADNRAALYLGDQGWYDNAIWAGDPTDENLVVAGGINLWRSDDGGATLREISTWWENGSAHADHHAIVSHPAYDGVNNRTVFFGNDGGIYQAGDIRAVGSEAQPPYVNGWTELVNNYGVTQFYGGAGNAASGKIIGGAQDNGTICFDPARGTEQWATIFGGDGGWCAADPSDPKVFYGEYVFLNIHRNTDGGTTDDTQGNRYISGQFWNPSAGDWQWKPAPFRISDVMNFDALFIAPFTLDPNEPKRLLAGGLSLWRTNDAKAPNTFTSGPQWRAIKQSAGSNISAIAIAKGSSDVVWVGHEDGKVFRTLDGSALQPSWQRMDSAGAKPLQAQRFCTCITVDHASSKVVYVAFGGYEKANIWTTRDGGLTWTNLGAALPAAPARAIAVHPRHSNFIYLGTEVGVFASENSGASWSPTNEGPTNCSVDDLFWIGETLVCATHGRGMFRIDLSGV